MSGWIQEMMKGRTEKAERQRGERQERGAPTMWRVVRSARTHPLTHAHKCKHEHRYTHAHIHCNIIRITHTSTCVTHLTSSLVSVAALLSSRPPAATAKGSPSFPDRFSSVRPPARTWCVCVCVCVLVC
jgi:hypothetical protein